MVAYARRIAHEFHKQHNPDRLRDIIITMGSKKKETKLIETAGSFDPDEVGNKVAPRYLNARYSILLEMIFKRGMDFAKREAIVKDQRAEFLIHHLGRSTPE